MDDWLYKNGYYVRLAHKLKEKFGFEKMSKDSGRTYIIRIYDHPTPEDKENGVMVWKGDSNELSNIPYWYLVGMYLREQWRYEEGFYDYHIFSNVYNQKTLSLNELSKIVDQLRNHSTPQLSSDEIIEVLLNQELILKTFMNPGNIDDDKND